MSVTLEELNRFHGFAVAQIDAAEHEWTLQDLLDEWELQNSDPTRRQEDVLAIRAALRDLERGDRGIPFDEHIQSLATEFGLEAIP